MEFMNTIEISTNNQKMISFFASEQFYHSQDVFIRELLQNAYDACNTRQALEWSWGAEFLEATEAELLHAVRRDYVPRIVISYNSKSRVLFVEDNGIGINESDLHKYVASLGSSYYTSKAFRQQRLAYEPISQFGIGLCSCFQVSRAILIESKKSRTVNTAWNVSDRQSLEPIAAKWFRSGNTIEYVASSRTMVGTRITLVLEEDYARKMSLKFLVRVIQHYMVYQKIPIDIFFDNKKTTVHQPEMVRDNPYAYVLGVTTLLVQNDLLEGYFIIYHPRHSHLIEDSELYQQGFRVTENPDSLNLKPEWLQHLSFHLNIKKKLLNLNMARNGLSMDENTRQLRQQIGRMIISYFGKNPLGLTQYLPDGDKNILSRYENEMRLVEKAVYVSIYLKGQELDLSMETIMSGFFGKEVRVASISKELFHFFEDKYPVDFKSFIERYNMVVFEKNHDIFVQFFAPYMKSQKYVVSALPGIVYVDIIAEIHSKEQVSNFRNRYQLYPKPRAHESVFCFVTDIQGKYFEVIINENHRNAKLLSNCPNALVAYNLLEVIKENIKQRMMNHHSHWDKIIDFGGSFVEEWRGERCVTVQAIGCLENNFADSVNRFIRGKFSNMELRNLGLTDLEFKREDFLQWWYAAK